MSGTDMAESVRRLVSVYKQSLLAATPQAVDYSRDVVSQGEGGHGKHGTTTTTPSFGGDLPIPVRIERWLSGAVALWEHELQRETMGVERAGLPPELIEAAAALNGVASRSTSGDRKSNGKRTEDRLVLQTKGDAIVVGLLFGRTSEAIRKLRERANQDPHSGEPVAVPRPLTSPAVDTLKQHESTTTTEGTDEA